jgi:hypothetical protein
MNPIPGLSEAIHGNEEEKGRQEGCEEKVDEEARSGQVARHPPAAVAVGSVLPALAGSAAS